MMCPNREDFFQASARAARRTKRG